MILLVIQQVLPGYKDEHGHATIFKKLTSSGEPQVREPFSGWGRASFHWKPLDMGQVRPNSQPVSVPASLAWAPRSAPLSSGPSDAAGLHIHRMARSMKFSLQGTGPTVGFHLKNKEEYWPFQGKTKANFSPMDPFSFMGNSMQTPGPPLNYI